MKERLKAIDTARPGHTYGSSGGVVVVVGGAPGRAGGRAAVRSGQRMAQGSGGQGMQAQAQQGATLMHIECTSACMHTCMRDVRRA